METGTVELRGTARRLADALGTQLALDDIYASGAHLYDLLVADDRSELPQMIAATRGLRGDVLDLGCGSGRLTLPFLARGHAVLGIDLSSRMIELLRSKAAGLPVRLAGKLDLAVADMSVLDVGERRFDIVVLGTTTITLLGDDERMRTLALVRRVLTDRGRLLVSTLDVDDDCSAGQERICVAPLRDEQGRVVLATLFEEVDLDAGFRYVSVLEQTVEDLGVGPRLYHSRVKLIREQQLLADLEATGLTVSERFVLDEHDATRVVLFSCARAYTEGES